ncbi:MAG: hypothetical protein HS104_17855 [Polyangiaceae bacterium]|nr:hypothetical protein [Polyangiaceae bacterium]
MQSNPSIVVVSQPFLSREQCEELVRMERGERARTALVGWLHGPPLG